MTHRFEAYPSFIRRSAELHDQEQTLNDENRDKLTVLVKGSIENKEEKKKTKACTQWMPSITT